jgi:uncharacterized protein
MDIKHKKLGNKELFYIEENGNTIASIYCEFEPESTFIIRHTEVDPAYNGKGLGKKLVLHVVEYARKNHYKIKPFCPYARAILLKSSEFVDVLA